MSARLPLHYVIGLGANLGDRAATLKSAVVALWGRGKVEIKRSASAEASLTKIRAPTSEELPEELPAELPVSLPAGGSGTT